MGLPSEGCALCIKSSKIPKDESLVPLIPTDAFLHEHLLLFSPEREHLLLPSTRPAICVSRGRVPVSVPVQTSAQKRESVPLDTPAITATLGSASFTGSSTTRSLVTGHSIRVGRMYLFVQMFNELSYERAHACRYVDAIVFGHVQALVVREAHCRRTDPLSPSSFQSNHSQHSVASIFQFCLT